MARPYSDDLRERVAGSVASGRSCRETARLFGVSVASVVKWSQRHRATGSAAAKAMGGKRQPVLEAERAWGGGGGGGGGGGAGGGGAAGWAQQPELTVRTLAAELAERGKPVSPNTVWVLLRRAGHSFKKNAVRHRTGQAGDRQAPRAVEEVPGSA